MAALRCAGARPGSGASGVLSSAWQGDACSCSCTAAGGAALAGYLPPGARYERSRTRAGTVLGSNGAPERRAGLRERRSGCHGVRCVKGIPVRVAAPLPPTGRRQRPPARCPGAHRSGVARALESARCVRAASPKNAGLPPEVSGFAMKALHPARLLRKSTGGAPADAGNPGSLNFRVACLTIFFWDEELRAAPGSRPGAPWGAV